MSQSPLNQVNGTNNIPALATALTTVARDARSGVNQSCFLCLKDAVECDMKRPCARCKSLSVPHMCFGAELHQKAHNQHKEERYNKKRKRNLLPESETELSTYHPFISQNSVDNGIVVNSSGLEQTKEDLVKTNCFLIAELKKVKEEQSRMKEELHNLRIENEILKERFNKFLMTSLTPQASLSSNAYSIQQQMQWTAFLNQIHRSENRDTAMVIFDLVKSPAVVLTANEQFCRLFGYKTDEIVGMPWKQFIHPDYLERTTAILRQKNLQPKIQFLQVYRTASGTTFVALDTHTFFGGAVPRADLVAIQPLHANLQNALPSPANRNFWPVSMLSLKAPQSATSSQSPLISTSSSSAMAPTVTSVYSSPSTASPASVVQYNYSHPPLPSTSTSTPMPPLTFPSSSASSATPTLFVPVTTTTQDVTSNIYATHSNTKTNNNVTISNSILLSTGGASSATSRPTVATVCYTRPGVGVNVITPVPSASVIAQTPPNVTRAEEAVPLYTLTAIAPNTNTRAVASDNNSNNSNNKNSTPSTQFKPDQSSKTLRVQNSPFTPNAVTVLTPNNNNNTSAINNNNNNNTNNNNKSMLSANGVITHGNIPASGSNELSMAYSPAASPVSARLENVTTSTPPVSQKCQITGTNVIPNDSQPTQPQSANVSVIHIPPPSTPPSDLTHLSEFLDNEASTSQLGGVVSNSLTSTPFSPFANADTKGNEHSGAIDSPPSSYPPQSPNLPFSMLDSQIPLSTIPTQSLSTTQTNVPELDSLAISDELDLISQYLT